MAAAVWENRSRAGLLSDWQSRQPGASRKQELKTMTVLCLCYCVRRPAHTWPLQRTDWLSELAGDLCEQAASGAADSTDWNFPSSSQAGGPWADGRWETLSSTQEGEWEEGRGGGPVESQRKGSEERTTRAGHASLRSGTEWFHHDHDHYRGLPGVSQGGRDSRWGQHDPTAAASCSSLFFLSSTLPALCRRSPVVSAVFHPLLLHLLTPDASEASSLSSVWRDLFTVDVFNYQDVMGAASGKAPLPLSCLFEQPTDKTLLCAALPFKWSPLFSAQERHFLFYLLARSLYWMCLYILSFTIWPLYHF